MVLIVARTLFAAIAISVTAIAVNYMPFHTTPLASSERLHAGVPAPR